MYPQQPQYGAPTLYNAPPPAAPPVATVQVPANTVNLENGQNTGSDDLNIPKNIKEIKGLV